MKLLDLFCGAGGAGMGYHKAGFEVVGVDIRPQPRYPFSFVQADALDYAAAHGWEFDAIHASPPCQRYSRITPVDRREEKPDLVAPTRWLLETLGLPYVIENVVGAPLCETIMLCGAMFGLQVYRHRIFESNILLLAPTHTRHIYKCPPAGKGAGKDEGGFISITSGGQGMGKGGRDYARRAMGIDWMTGDELAEAIPPAFTKYIGQQLMTACIAWRERTA